MNESYVETLTSSISLEIVADIETKYSDGTKINWTIPTMQYNCKLDPLCKDMHGINQPIFSFSSVSGRAESEYSKGWQQFACTLRTYITNAKGFVFCLKLIHNDPPLNHATMSVDIQSQMVLMENNYAAASNSCMNALDGQCHWIPFSTITNKKCIDCPPICRGKHQTLTLPQVVLGLAVLIIAEPFEWVSLLAIVTNQLSGSKRLQVSLTENLDQLYIIIYDYISQAIVIGALNAVTYVSLCIGPLLGIKKHMHVAISSEHT